MNIDVKDGALEIAEAAFAGPVAAMTAVEDSVIAVVKWFRADKGYGFVGLTGRGDDAFLHVKALRGLGLDSAPMGATVRVQLQNGPRGLQVARVLELDPSTAPAVDDLSRAPARRWAERGPTIALTGKVKWFDDVRGFGFVTGDDFGRDVFVHCSIFDRTGLTRLVEGQTVTMQVVETVKGRQAVEIEADPA